MGPLVLMFGVTAARCLQVGLAVGLLLGLVALQTSLAPIPRKASLAGQPIVVGAILLASAGAVVSGFLGEPLPRFLGGIATLASVVLATLGFGIGVGWRLAARALVDPGNRRTITGLALGWSVLALVGALGVGLWKPLALLMPVSFYGLVATVVYAGSQRPKLHVALILAAGALEPIAVIQDKYRGLLLTTLTVALLLAVSLWAVCTPRSPGPDTRECDD